MKSKIQEAGLARFGVLRVICIFILAVTLIGVFAYQVVSIWAFAFSASISSAAFMLEVLTARARRRGRLISAAWPDVLDSLATAGYSGISLSESLTELGETAPDVLREHFKILSRNLDSGDSLAKGLEMLKAELGDIQVDRLVELLHIAHSSGGEGYNEALRNQAQIAREELALWGEIESKQGWISGTAKIALAAPWLIVAMLSTRAENAKAFSSNTGASILIFGLLVSLFAYRLIQVLGAIEKPRRVFI